VPLLTVDSLVNRRVLVPRAMKIDVEGAELDVLIGARHTLRAHAPRTFVGLHWYTERMGLTPLRLLEWCDREGHAIATLDGVRITSPEHLRRVSDVEVVANIAQGGAFRA
jgi:hypothetical protein